MPNARGREASSPPRSRARPAQAHAPPRAHAHSPRMQQRLRPPRNIRSPNTINPETHREQRPAEEDVVPQPDLGGARLKQVVVGRVVG